MRVFLSLFLCLISAFNLAYAQAVGDYRSNVTTGTWHTVGSWQVLASLGPEVWNTAVAVPPTTVGTTITIRSGHTITLAASAGAVALSNNLTINAGGALTVNNASNSSANDLSFTGTGVLRVDGTLTFGSGGANTKLSLSSGTTFISGTISNAGTGASFVANGGTVQFNGTPASVTGAAFSFFNVVVNASSTLTVNASTSVTVTQDLTNNGTFNAGNTLTITRDLINNSTFTAGTTLNLRGTLTNGGTFNAGTTFNLDGTNNAVVNDFINNGTFSAGSGSVNFNSTVQGQNISGSAPLTTFNNLNVNNDFAGVNIETDVALTGTLTLGAGASFDADGSADTGVLTVRSTGVGAGGRIADMTGVSGNFSGAVTIERFVDGPDTWRYLSMPITNGNVGMWQDVFPVTGDFSDPSPEGVNGVDQSEGTSIYYYDPAVGDYVGVDPGATVSTDDTPLDNTVGYSVYTYLTGNFTISVRGEIGKGDIPVAVSTANGGFNLVPNPYPSAIDWENVDNTGLNDAMWILAANNQFTSYVGGTATNAPFGGWTGEVAVGQSFWVQSTAATTLTFQEDDKTAGQYQFLKQEAPRDYMRVTLVSADEDDESVIRFVNDAVEGFDARYDARKRKNGGINLSSYTTSVSDDYAINSVPVIQCAVKSVKLNVDDVPAGSYKLKFSDLDKMDLGYAITLVDKFLVSETTVVDNGQEYSFDVTVNALSKGADRFELKFKPQELDLQRNLQPASAQTCADPLVKLEVSDTQPGVKYTFRLNNTNLHEAIVGNGEKISVFVNKSSLAFGQNNLSLAASSVAGCDTHTFNDALNVKVDQVYEVANVTPAQRCGPGSVTLSATGAPQDGAYKWYEASTAVDPIPSANQAAFATPALAESKTYFVSVVNASGCESAQRLAVEAKIASVYEVTGVTAAQHCGAGSVTLSAAGAPQDGSYKWYEASNAVEPIPSANQGAFTTPVLTESKTYFVSAVSAIGCESSQRHAVEAKIVHLAEPVISVNGYILSAGQQTGVQWYKDNEPIDGATSGEYDVKQTGVYKVVVTKEGCKSESDDFNFIISGIEDMSSQFQFYPNPTSDYLNIASVPSDVLVSLYDSQGRLVNEAPVEAHNEGITIDMRALKKGMYLVGLRKQSQFFRIKIVKK